MARATRNLYQGFANYISDYVQENLHQPLMIEDIAARVGISRFHLNRLFQATTGFQLGEFILRRRLQKAWALLRDGESVLAVSLAVGYESHAAFSRAFGRAFGCVPSDIKAGQACAWQTPDTLKNSGARDLQLRPEILDLPEQVFYGHYGTGFSDHSFVALAAQLLQRLQASIQSLGLAGFPAAPFGVVLENPWQGEPNQIRFFMGFAAADLPAAADMHGYVRAGGRWARFCHQGEYQLIWQSISRIYAGWVIPEGIPLRDHEIVQHYLTEPRTKDARQPETALYFPLQD